MHRFICTDNQTTPQHKQCKKYLAINSNLLLDELAILCYLSPHCREPAWAPWHRPGSRPSLKKSGDYCRLLPSPQREIMDRGGEAWHLSNAENAGKRSATRQQHASAAAHHCPKGRSNAHSLCAKEMKPNTGKSFRTRLSAGAMRATIATLFLTCRGITTIRLRKTTSAPCSLAP